jgi:hypothetical protein
MDERTALLEILTTSWSRLGVCGLASHPPRNPQGKPRDRSSRVSRRLSLHVASDYFRIPSDLFLAAFPALVMLADAWRRAYRPSASDRHGT